MVPSKTCSCVGEGLFAETDLKINLIYNGPLGYHLGFVCPSFCLRLCRKTQPLQNMRGVWLLSLHLKMSPQVHSNLCKGVPQAFSCTNHPWLSTQCIALHQFNMDTNIPPGVCLLVLPISRHLNVRAKVGWFCHPRRSNRHLGPRALFHYLESYLLFFFGSYHFRLAWGTWTSLCLSRSNPWL